MNRPCRRKLAALISGELLPYSYRRFISRRRSGSASTGGLGGRGSGVSRCSLISGCAGRSSTMVKPRWSPEVTARSNRRKITSGSVPSRKATLIHIGPFMRMGGAR